MSVNLKTLECPFKWKPDHKSSCDYLYAIINTVENNIKRHPFLQDGYISLLVYLYTRPLIADYNTAFDWLEKMQGTSLPSDFIKSATRLKLEEHMNSLPKNKIKKELKKLSELWKSTDTKVAVFLMKGAALNCFGPTKGGAALQSYKKALNVINGRPKDPFSSCQFNTLKFFALWGCAVSMCRSRRQVSNQSPSKEEIEFWESADRIQKESSGIIDLVQTMWFCCHYAEAVLANKDQCLELITLVRDSFEKLPDDQKNVNAEVLLTCNKVWRRFGQNQIVGKEEDEEQWISAVTAKLIEKWHQGDKRSKEDNILVVLASIDILKDQTTPDVESSKNVKKLTSEAKKYLGQNIDYHLQISKVYSDNITEENEKAIAVLKIAKTSLMPTTGHIWLDLELARRQRISKGDEKWARREYESLLSRYSGSKRNRANILLERSEFLFNYAKQKEQFGSYVDEIMKDIIEAKNVFPELVIKKQFSKKLHRVMLQYRERPEYEAWFYHRIDRCGKPLSEISELYRKALSSTDPKTTNFALEHFGRFCLYETKEFGKAISSFQQLPFENEHRKYLLSEAVISHKKSNSSSETSLLLECLKLGNCDVIKLLLECMQHEKEALDLKAELQSPDFFDTGQSLMFFSRKNYETCAMIENLMEDTDGRQDPFFVKRCAEVTQKFRNKIFKEVSKFLEIPSESTGEMNFVWRRQLLDATKMYLRKKGVFVSAELKIQSKKSNYAKNKVQGKRASTGVDTTPGTQRKESKKTSCKSVEESFKIRSDFAENASPSSKASGKRRYKSGNDIERVPSTKNTTPGTQRKESRKTSCKSVEESFKIRSDFAEKALPCSKASGKRRYKSGNDIERVPSTKNSGVEEEIPCNKTDFTKATSSIESPEENEIGEHSRKIVVAPKPPSLRKRSASPVFTAEERYAFNLKLINVLKDVRSPLDRSMKKLFPDTRIYYPFGFQPTIDYNKQQDNRMELMLAMTLEDLKKKPEACFKEKKITVTNEVTRVISFMANRDIHIIKDKGGWLALWANEVNDDKHNTPWNIAAFENDLNDYRRTAKLPDDVTAYDVAHWAAEFAEQSIILLDINIETEKPHDCVACPSMVNIFKQNLFWSQMSQLRGFLERGC